jgi:hypothetical protein
MAAVTPVSPSPETAWKESTPRIRSFFAANFRLAQRIRLLWDQQNAGDAIPAEQRLVDYFDANPRKREQFVELLVNERVAIADVDLGALRERKSWSQTGSRMCPACKQRTRDTLIDCGHVFCSHCLSAAESKDQCPDCQKQFRSRRTVYV